jgi:hypothetical protein
MYFLSFTRVYLFWSPSYISLILNYHGCFNNKWLTCIETTSHKILSEYFPKKKWHQDLFCNLYIIIFIQPLKPIRSMTLNSFQIQFSNKHNTSNISTTSIIYNHTIYLVIDMTSHMKDILPCCTTSSSLVWTLSNNLPLTKYSTSL